MTSTSDNEADQPGSHPGAPAAAQVESSEAPIQGLAQIYRAFSNINQAILRSVDEKELFPLVCQSAVELTNVSLAWIGVADLESRQIRPVESFGTGKEHLRNVEIPTLQDSEQVPGPIATAYRSSLPVIINAHNRSPVTALRYGTAIQSGWGSSGCFPIQRDGQPFAVLTVHHEAEKFFGEEIIGLFEKMAHDVTFALDNFDRERTSRMALEALRATEQHFRAYFERSMFGMAALRPDRSWMEVNQALCDMLGYTTEELTAKTWDKLNHPDDTDASELLFEQLLAGSTDEFVMENRFVAKNQDFVDVHVAVRAVRNADGSLAYAVSLIEDISLRKLAERREKMRQKTLEKVARGAALNEIMSEVILSAESIYPSSMCSILLMDEAGSHLCKGAAPRLPEFFNDAINGVEIGPGVGSCGTAAFLGKRVVVEQIRGHPYWQNYKELAAEAGLASCWSEPIYSVSGKILGTFAIYRGEASTPDNQEIALIESAANLIGIAIDRIHAEAELHLAWSIYENSSEAVLVTDTNNRIVALNPAFTNITGYSLGDIQGEDPAVLRSARHDDHFYKTMWDELSQQGFWQGEIWNRRKNGETFPEWLTINVIRNDKGEIQRYVAMGSDITNKMRSDELIWRQANYDCLTDLPNRYMFQDRLEQEIRKSQRQDSLLALMFIDLDNFKDVNDTLGHPVGDQLLIKAAERINSCVRKSDTVARMGGDEFTVMLPELSQTVDGEYLAEQIINVLAEPYSINGNTIYAPASIGITFCPDDSSEVDQLISNADQAMYASKNAGRNRLSYFTRSLHDDAQKRLKLLNDLRTAVEYGQFELYFQPIIDLDSSQVTKAEALIRWYHPERGTISPAEFIPLAEESGLIVKIGDWVFRESAAQAKRWYDLLNIKLQISVNMSPVQFQSEALDIPDWLAYLRTLGLHESHLSIEITEGLLLNASNEVKDRLLQFRDAGIEVAIDDFGVGYSALSYLKRFDIDYLKIDQSFIRNLETEQNDLVLSEAIVIMAHKLGLGVIAEGVETEAQRRLLKQIGCDNGQGYLFSRPLPASEFEKFLGKG